MISKYLRIQIIVFFCVQILFSQPKEVKISAEDGETDDNFGIAVAVDQNVAVVGAYWDDDNGRDTGAIYVYHKEDGDWTFHQKLAPEDVSIRANFGSSVAVDGQFIIAGAPKDDVTDESSGSVYIFKYDSVLQTWSQFKKLISGNDTSAYNEFGTAVTIAGNYLAVGSIGEQDYSGSVYLYHWDGSQWQEPAILTAEDQTPNAFFGFSLAMESGQLLAGAPFGPGGGAVYPYQLQDTLWTPQEKITITGDTENPTFGYAVSLLDDHALIGATTDVSDGISGGAAYIFQHEGQTWHQQQKLINENALDNDQFGFSVALSPDYAIIGARLDDLKGGDSGSLFVFNGTGDGWYLQTRLVASDGGAGDMLGYALAQHENEIITGAPGSGGTGAVYFYTNWLTTGLDRIEEPPGQFTLKQNYPNPFNPVTRIPYELDRRAHVQITVYSILGEEINTLVNAVESPGYREVIWNGRDYSGQPVASGIYICRFRAGESVQSRKMILLR